MSYLIAAATLIEIQPTIERLRKLRSSPVPEIDILITGIGLTAATWSITRQVFIKKPKFIIQAGIGGSFDPSVKLGTVFAIKQDTIADLAVIENGNHRTIFEMGLESPNSRPYLNGRLSNRSSALKKAAQQKVNAISVNEISTDPGKIRLYRSKFRPVLESMEGAALHYVGIMEGIPFIQLRAVSNYVGERNKKNWKMELAIRNLNKDLLALLKLVPQPNVIL